MTREVATIDSESSSLEAARRMGERGVGSLVVVDKGRPVGIVTERDFLRKISAENKRPSELRVLDIMSSPLFTVSSNESTIEAARLMFKSRVRRLVVMDAERMVGIITSADLVRSLTR